MIFIGYIFHEDPSKGKMIIEEQVFWFGLLFFTLFLIILDINADHWTINWVRITFKILAFCSLIVSFFGKFLAMNKKEPIEGLLKGSIKITPHLIEVEQSSYEVKDIINLNIDINNFSGELQGKLNYPGPWRSNGLGNLISFNHNGKTIKKAFVIQNEKDFKTLQSIKQEINNMGKIK